MARNNLDLPMSSAFVHRMVLVVAWALWAALVSVGMFVLHAEIRLAEVFSNLRWGAQVCDMPFSMRVPPGAGGGLMLLALVVGIIGGIGVAHPRRDTWRGQGLAALPGCAVALVVLAWVVTLPGVRDGMRARYPDTNWVPWGEYLDSLRSLSTWSAVVIVPSSAAWGGFVWLRARELDLSRARGAAVVAACAPAAGIAILAFGVRAYVRELCPLPALDPSQTPSESSHGSLAIACAAVALGLAVTVPWVWLRTMAPRPSSARLAGVAAVAVGLLALFTPRAVVSWASRSIAIPKGYAYSLPREARSCGSAVPLPSWPARHAPDGYAPDDVVDAPLVELGSERFLLNGSLARTPAELVSMLQPPRNECAVYGGTPPRPVALVNVDVRIPMGRLVDAFRALAHTGCSVHFVFTDRICVDHPAVGAIFGERSGTVVTSFSSTADLEGDVVVSGYTTPRELLDAILERRSVGRAVRLVL